MSANKNITIFAVVGVILISSGIFAYKFSANASVPDTDASEEIITSSQQELISSIPGLVTSQQTLLDQVSSLNKSSDALSKLPQDLESGLDSLDSITQSRIGNLDTAMKHRLGLLETKLSDYESELSNLKDKLDKLEEGKAKAARNKFIASKRELNATPKFIVQSIMYWDSKPVVIVRFNESTVSLSAKDMLDGWIVNSIDASCAQFKKKSAVKRLCI